MLVFHRLNATAAGIIAICGLLACAPNASAAPVTQSTAPAGSDAYWYASGWAWQNLGTVTLAPGTDTVLALTSTVTLVDQGWGNVDPGGNQVLISLFDNTTPVWNQHVAGASHSLSTQTFDITDSVTNPMSLTGLETALAGIDWSANPTVTLQMNAALEAYPGWELHTSNASFSVTTDSVSTPQLVSAEVPEPMSIALFGTALVGVGLIRRRRPSASGVIA